MPYAQNLSTTSLPLLFYITDFIHLFQAKSKKYISL